ncbi:TonB-dependent receptor domain-containing protein [Sphingomonas sp.]|uniref:TonB-dependent receptor n=1 Tax=Sphingomonas sp. TaxID=28214 RepID=UPI00286BF166|nr:TonB-dependent receptor [Sphingomonas sp.]
MNKITFHAGSALALSLSAPAWAQDPQSTPGDPPAVQSVPESTRGEDETIVVTAQLREQRLIEVPFAVTAFTGKALDQLGVQEFEDLARYTPGLAVQNQSPNNAAINIRGVTSDSADAFFEPRISIYQDGVSISKPRGAYVELFDVERVEVSKGPQSTLYGRGALIGAINIVQAKPDLTQTSGMARAEYGNFDYMLGEAMINAPLGENAAIRIAGRYKQRDGTVKNLLGGGDFQSVKTGAVRASLRVRPSERITFDVIGNYQKDTPNGTAFKSLAFRPTDPVTGEVLGGTGIHDGAALVAGDNFDGGRDLGLKRTVWGVTGLMKAELNDAFTLNSITAYRQFHALEVLDADGTSLPVITAADDARSKQFSQELRLTWNDGGPVTAFVGTSFFHEKGSDRTPAQFDERAALAQIAGALNGGGFIPGRPASDPAPMALIGNPGFTSLLLQGVAGSFSYLLPGAIANGIAANLKAAHDEEQTSFSKTDAFDIFGDVSFKVSPQFEVGAGLRWTHDDKTSGVQAEVQNGRSILGGFLGALSQPEPFRTLLLNALAVPGAATIPPSIFYPVPIFGLTFQATPGNARINQSFKDNGFTWRGFARYQPTPDSSIYAIYARGRRPEVLNALPPELPGADARFVVADSESVDSFEIGAKTTALDRRLYLDGALFYYKYKNFQTTEQIGTTFVTSNAGKADSYGFEGQARYSVGPALKLFANYAFNHARFKSGVFKGNRFRLSPDHTFSAGGTFTTGAPGGRIDFTPAVTYQSKVFFDNDNDRPELQTVARGKIVPDTVQDELQKGFALVSARLGYTLSGSTFRIEAFADNVLNKKYIKDAGNTGDALGMATFIPGEPRTYGLQLTTRF